MKKKKISIIIGGTKGIGYTITKELKKRGDHIIVAARNNENKKKIVKLDLMEDESIDNFIKKLKNKKIDNLIFSQRYRGLNLDEELQVVVKSTEKIINSLKKNFKKNSSIVILSSVSTKGVLLDQNLNYHIVRGAIDQLMKFFAVFLGPRQIRVNCIMASRAIKKENKTFYMKKTNVIRKNLEKITPLKRMSTDKDIANLVNILTLDISNFITGSSIIVDGGLSLINQEHILYKK